METLWLFVFGAAIGSFVNVVAMRYKPEKFLLSPKVIGGRSVCPRCGHALRWFELVPLLSFLWLFGRCRSCKTKISLQYPAVEVVSGLIFVFVPMRISRFAYGADSVFSPAFLVFLSSLWVIFFLALLVITLIDKRMHLIPDEANLLLAALGIAWIVAKAALNFDFGGGSFIGSYALIFGLAGSTWLNHAAALLFGAGFFGGLIAITKGRGMGMGDLKLGGVLGLAFGWPDVVIIVALAFIVGSLFGLGAILAKKKRMKSFLPFGPFLAIGTALTFFFGLEIVGGYFKLFHL